MTDIGFFTGLVAASIQAGTPILLATLGEIICERSGILNLGVEGMMLVGAMTGFAATLYSGSPVLGACAAVLASGFMALIHAFLTISLQANQTVSGLGPDHLRRRAVRVFRHLPGGPHRARVRPHRDPLSFRHPLPGPSPVQAGRPGLSGPDPGAGHLVVPVQDPPRADPAGLRREPPRPPTPGASPWLRPDTSTWSSAGSWPDWAGPISPWATPTCGWRTWWPGGAGSPWPWSSSGSGTRARPQWGAFLFGGVGVLQLRVQAAGTTIPSSILAMLPYILTVLVLVLITLRQRKTGRVEAPEALGLPFRRGE